MVPTDYRLDHVAAHLIERLEASRPAWAHDPVAAEQALRRTADEHVDAAMGEFRELALDQAPDEHAAFVLREVQESLLPRYRRLALEMTRLEDTGFGFGKLAEPTGRLLLLAGSLLVLWFVLLRLVYLPIVWPILVLDLSVVFWPDIAGALYRRRYRRRLEQVVVDMGRIQEQSDAYVAPSRLQVEDEPTRPIPIRPKERE